MSKIYRKQSTGTTSSTGKTVKGSVSIEFYQNRLRLRFSYQGQRFTISLGVCDTKTHWRKATAIAKLLEADITLGKFNPNNLTSYQLIPSPQKPPTIIDSPFVPPEQNPAISLFELWQQYFNYKSPSWKATTQEYMRFLAQKVLACPIQQISRALEIREWLLNNTTTSMTKRVLTHLSAAVDWGIKHGLIDSQNPFDGMAKDLPKHQWEINSPPNAFTEDETHLIFEAFSTSPYYSHYCTAKFYSLFC